jgi:hypothetical protein
MDFETGANPGDRLSYLVDFNDREPYRLGVWPKPSESHREFPAAYNVNWVVIRDEGADGTVNGVVLTEAGPDTTGSRITGFQIVDPVVRQEVEDAIDGLDVSTLSLIYRSGANSVNDQRILSWDSTSGTLLLERAGMPYLGYLQFAITGSERFLTEAGEYTLDLGRRRVLLRDTGDGADVRLAAVASLWLSDADSDVEFQNIEFVGTNANAGAPAQVQKSFGGASENRLVLRNCRLTMGFQGARGAIDFIDTELKFFRGDCATASDGMTAERSFFWGAERYSGVTVMCPGTEGAEIPVRQTTIRDCFFTNPFTNHGQGVSLYSNSWQNAIIEHNIFLDCVRAFSFQPRNPRRTTPGVFRFANNLIIIDALEAKEKNGQGTFSFNGGPDTHLDDRQIVEVVSNAIVYNEDQMNTAAWTSPLAMDVRKLLMSSVVVKNNLAITINAAREEDGTRYHLRSNNLLYQPVWGAAWGQTDLQTPESYSAIFNFEELRPVGYNAYSASDGGPVGFRWGGEITMDDIRSLPDDWYERWPALEIPDAVGTSFTWFGEDYR